MPKDFQYIAAFVYWDDSNEPEGYRCHEYALEYQLAKELVAEGFGRIDFTDDDKENGVPEFQCWKHPDYTPMTSYDPATPRALVYADKECFISNQLHEEIQAKKGTQ